MIRLDKIISHQIEFYDLGDKRLNARCEKIHHDISASGANKSFPEIMKDRYQLKSFYNFMNNKKVSPEKIQLGNNNGLANYFNKEDISHHFKIDDLAKYIFNVQDTTFGKFHGRKTLELGYIETKNDNGIVIHNNVLMDSHHIPIALSCQDFIIRDKSNFGKSKQRKLLPFEEKESYKWTKGIDWATDFMKKLEQPQFKIVQVADREADIADWYNYAFENDASFIVRLSHNRLFADKSIKVKDFIRTKAIDFQTVRPIVDKYGKTNEINCAIRFAQVSLKELNKTVWVIHLKALEKVENLEETEWFLLTNLPVQTSTVTDEVTDEVIAKSHEMIMLVINAYTKRWRTVEDFHKCLKTGCAIEKRQFESPHALKNMIAIMSIHAVRLLRMRHLADNQQDLPVQTILTEQETEVVKILAKKYLKPTDLIDAKAESVLWLVLLLGRMGGHQGFRAKGLPGWQTIFKGYLYFQNILEGIIISKNFFHQTPS